jgi:Protein of unknown function (DUF3617)
VRSQTRLSLLCLLALPAWSAESLPLPGLYHYQISTDLAGIPAEQHANFPLIKFDRCLSAEQLSSSSAMGLQTTPDSASRCQTFDFTLAQGKLSYRFQCDEGATLTGEGSGRYSTNQFTVNLISNPKPVFDGIPQIKQRLHAQRVKACPL